MNDPKYETSGLADCLRQLTHLLSDQDVLADARCRNMMLSMRQLIGDAFVKAGYLTGEDLIDLERQRLDE
jgi:hypothetical protein